MYRIPGLILFFFLNFLAAIAEDFNGVQHLLERRVPWLAPKVQFKSLKPTSKGDVFSLQTSKGHLTVAASSSSAAAMGINWYLKYYCKQSMSLESSNIKPIKKLPAIEGTLTQTTPFKYRYSLNYCTVNYTMSFYQEREWEYVLDWLALNGVNLALAPVGTEKIWDLTLRDFGFKKTERQAFIPGPAYSAWWLMGNLEGWGGPVSDHVLNQQSQLQKLILKRMNELGIEPVLQGFYGMVPNALQKKYPKANIINQGYWGPYSRPAILSPEESLFKEMAASYYKHLKNEYGISFRFFGGDPFHEGGISHGVDLSAAGENVYRAMTAAYPGSTWVLQGWSGNPDDRLMDKVPSDSVLILDLMGEDHQNWLSRKGYGGRNWIFGSVNNFGENEGLYGKLEYLANKPFEVMAIPEGKSLVGIGEIPEGYNNNPVLYDLIYDAAWQGGHVDIKQWINKYADFRYGGANADIKEAWQVFLNTVYSSKIEPQQGAPESVFCARPSLEARYARAWGTLKRSYDPRVFEAAVRKFATSASKYRNDAHFRYDLVDLVRQVVSNRGESAYQDMVTAFKGNNKDDFKRKSGYFLGLMKIQDSLLQTHDSFRLETWLKSASQFGGDLRDKENAVLNARTQISYWGPNQRDTRFNDYANKEWGGLMGTLYLSRWEQYIHYLEAKLSGQNLPQPDFFSVEKKWAEQPYVAEKPVTGDPVQKALQVLAGL
ncbi:alpha-N-acetylglucosaminidase TIM-barrel domain-containing protein [Arcticibacter sp.]|uniref:alpha-N-acetylglucosaminidase n=1 Tax=Arcticibacter sp. TaxID=1872630 RepID=UPI003890D510